MADTLILSIDQGTTSSRAILFAKDGASVFTAQREFTQHFPDSGWVEHDPEEIWQTTVDVCKEAIRAASKGGHTIAAAGITNQRETTVVWNKSTGKAIYNAIVWQDRRTASFCSELKESGYEPTFTAKTGLLLDPYFSGTKIKWILDNVEGARASAENGELAFGTIDSFLLWRFSNGSKHITDATNASRTLIYNIHNNEWDTELLSILDIPASMLPSVQDSSSDFGTIDKSLFGEEISIGGVAGDQQAATFGQVCLEPGTIKSTYGTGCFVILNTGKEALPSDNKLLTTVAYRLNNETTYAIEGKAMADDGVTPTKVRVDGGMVQNNWLCQFLADILGIPVERPVQTETTALGAAYLAGLHCGVYKNHDDLVANWQIDREFTPSMETEERDRLLRSWQTAVAGVIQQTEQSS